MSKPKQPQPVSTLDRLHPVIPPSKRRPLGWTFGGRVEELRKSMAVRP